MPLLAWVYDRYKKASSRKEAVVELRITYGRKQKYIATGIRLLPKQWHNGTVVGRVDAIQLQHVLDNLWVACREVCRQMMEEGNIDIFSIPDRLKRQKAGGIPFLDFCQKRVEVRSYNKSDDSRKRYERFLKKFIQWGEIEDWENLTEENIIAFDRYLAAKGLKKYSKWQNYHRILNSFIIDAINEGLMTKNPYKWLQIEKDKSRTGIGKYLSPEEFGRLRAITLTSESLERVRDLFVFQTYTCMAYTDMVAFDAKKIQEVKGMKVYVAKRNKTHETFTIPLLRPAVEILEKYHGKLPILHNVKYNEYLKVVAQAAGIDKPVSSHWARHTGATILLNEGGFDLKIIAKICGHSSTRITEKVYAKLLDETVVDAMAEFDKEI